MTDWGHLKLRGWPFRMAPDAESARVWADRASVKQQIDRLVWNWRRQDRSHICIMWGTLGAGKSHAQRYLQRQLSDGPGILAVYALMPKEIRAFLDVYKAVIAMVDVTALAASLIAAEHESSDPVKVSKEIFPAFPDAARILRLSQSDIVPQRQLAQAWIRGDKLPSAELKKLGVMSSIKTTDDCVSMLSGVTRLIHRGPCHRLLVMIDECQRVWDFKMAVGKDINTGLQTWFDSNPNNLTLLLSFKCGDESHVRKAFLSEDIQDRASWPAISMPSMQKADAMEFIRALLQHFHSDPTLSPWHPFPEGVVRAVVDRLVSRSGTTPRLLMKAFDALLAEIDYRVGREGSPILTEAESWEIVRGAINQLSDDEP